MSSGLGESDDVGALAEALSAEHEVVFADETHLASALPALSAVLSVFAWVSSPEQVWHVCGNIINIYI